MNLTTKISNRSLVLLWELSLLLHAPVFKWMKLRQIFLKRRSLKHLYGRDILTISFLFGRMEKRNLKSLWRNLKTFFAEPSIYIRVIEKRVTFVDLNVSLENVQLLQIYILRIQIVLNTSIVVPHIQII